MQTIIGFYKALKEVDQPSLKTHERKALLPKMCMPENKYNNDNQGKKHL